MSYDLLFVSEPRRPIPDPDRFRQLLAARPFYALDGNQAIYEHPDTGVYFLLELADEPTSDDEPQGWLQAVINLLRPTSFGRESALELAMLAQDGAGPIHDPQDPEGGVRQFDAARYLESWQRANAGGCRAILTDPAQPGERTATMPAALLERIWRWNRTRGARQQAAGEQVFIPQVPFLKVGDRVVSTAVWSDAVPAHLPEVETVVVYRDAIHKRRLFRRSEPDMALAPWRELIAQLEGFPRREAELPYLDLTGLNAEPRLLDYLRALPRLVGRPSLVSADLVLDAELVTAAE